MNHIELFAGCGGLCLGLSTAGFELRLANELSPMASETFAYNILGEDLQDAPEESRHTLWLSSQYSRQQMAKRLREDPREYPPSLNSDVLPDGSNLEGSLIVGNIIAFNDWLEEHLGVAERLRGSGVDLVSGGPPCQSFSLAGLREKNNAKNLLPWEFARFVGIVRPRCALLENVTGILRPFTEKGQKYHAWFEVAKAFASIGYVPLPLHVNAKFAGVAQNRPRFLLVSLREDEFRRLKPSFNAAELKLFRSSEVFYEKLKSDGAATLADLHVHDLNSGDAQEFALFEQSFLRPLVSCPDGFATVQDAIQDLEQGRKLKKSAYVSMVNRLFGPEVQLQSRKLTGHHFISITPRVRRRFRIYQVAARLGKAAQNEISAVISEKATTISDAVWKAVRPCWFIGYIGERMEFASKADFVAYLKSHHSKKQTQKALLPDAPAPAALSIPDDACHYSDVRTLTTREMARIQSFPDAFVFRSKATTGGLNRRFEVPIYTQIGNAVPVLLAYAIGQSLVELLGR